MRRENGSPARRGLACALALAAAGASGAAAAGPSPAQAETLAGPAAEAPAPPEAEALPQLGLRAAPRRGFFVDVGLGAFASAGGSRAVSAAQPYLSLAVGRDLGERGGVFLQLGVGASRASCFDGPTAGCAAADSFGATFAELGLRYGVRLSERVALAGLAVGGIAVLSPSPWTDAASAVPDAVSGPHAGAGAALDYDTHLDHFGVGVDLLARAAFPQRPGRGAAALLSVALAPRIKYVF